MSESLQPGLGAPFILDCCRITENAYFIKHKEKDFEEETYRALATEMFALADGAVFSAKKDGLLNMGGFLALTRHDQDDLDI